MRHAGMRTSDIGIIIAVLVVVPGGCLQDPVLAATMLPAEIAGIQSQNISANAKHFVCNNQEYNRNSVSENVPQRAFMELYTPGFQAAVDAGVGSIMCS